MTLRRAIPCLAMLVVSPACSGKNGGDSADSAVDSGDSAPIIDVSGDTADAGADVAYDGPTYTADDFESFHWEFMGGTGGPRRFFDLDHDCGVDASTDEFDGAVVHATCVVSADGCNAFKAYAVSPAVIGALQSDATCEPVATDDPEATSVTVTSGVVYERNTSGCAMAEPFATLQSKMNALACDTSDAGGD